MNAITLLTLASLSISFSNLKTNGESTVSRVVMGPPSYNRGSDLRELFEHPDEWKTTRSLINEILYPDQCFKPFTDEELKRWLGMMQQWNIRLGLDVGAIKEWGQTSEISLSVGRKYWDRIQGLGGHIHAMHMDEPLVCTRSYIHKSDDYAVDETAKFVAGIRKDYPDVLVGDVEAYPSVSLKDHIWWIATLQKRLAEMGVRGLDFYELDVNWMNFQIQHQGTWQEVKQLQNYCRTRQLPFSLIFWPGSYGWFKSINLADDSTCYVSVMNQGYEYSAFDAASASQFPALAPLKGGPDEYVIQSWEPCPSHSVPETGDFTFTRLVGDFVRKFVRHNP